MKLLAIISLLVCSLAVTAGEGGISGGGGGAGMIIQHSAKSGRPSYGQLRDMAKSFNAKVIRISLKDVIDVQLKNGDLIAGKELTKLPNVKRKLNGTYEITPHNNRIYDFNLRSEGIINFEELVTNE
jgi:hypothetical protein